MTTEIRMECLKIAASHGFGDSNQTLMAAKSYEEFVLGLVTLGKRTKADPRTDDDLREWVHARAMPNGLNRVHQAAKVNSGDAAK